MLLMGCVTLARYLHLSEPPTLSLASLVLTWWPLVLGHADEGIPALPTLQLSQSHSERPVWAVLPPLVAPMETLHGLHSLSCMLQPMQTDPSSLF